MARGSNHGPVTRVAGNILSKLIKFDNFLAKGEATILIALGAAMSVVCFLQVIFRYVLAYPLPWSEELARYLFVWLSIFGAALAMQKRGLFGLDIFFLRLPNQVRLAVGLLIHILIAGVVLVIFFEGIVLVQKTTLQESPAMGIPMSWAYACLPIGAALMAVHLVVIFFKDVVKQ